MILTFHILVATGSLVYATFLYFKPSKSGLVIAYLLVLSMLGSGVYLTIKNPAHLTQTCITGLVYLAIVSYQLFYANRKLAKRFNI